MASNKGFTLLEILIAITIMAALSFLTAISIRNTIDARRQIQTRIDVNSELRTAVKVIQRDIKSAYNYNNFNIAILKEIQKEQAKKQNNGQNPPTAPPTDEPPQPPPPPAQEEDAESEGQSKKTVLDVVNTYLQRYQSEKSKTQFMGSEDALHFTSSNHVRRFADAQESDLMEVGYYLAECRDLLDADLRSNCLWRRESPFIDNKVDEGGGTSVLLQNIKSLTFYYKGEEDFKEDADGDWRESWYTNERGDAITRNKFPVAVRVVIEAEIKGRNEKEDFVVAIDFTNNPEKVQNETNPQNPQ